MLVFCPVDIQYTSPVTASPLVPRVLFTLNITTKWPRIPFLPLPSSRRIVLKMVIPRTRTATQATHLRCRIQLLTFAYECIFTRYVSTHANAQDELERELGTDTAFKGSYGFARSYAETPNPALHLDDLGTIGLPLSEPEAKRIISRCCQAPFGKGERTVVDTEVRDTWEMDAAQVHFGNPAWQGFMDRVVQEVCQGLGVNYSASRPRCELYKLLLYENGSQ